MERIRRRRRPVRCRHRAGNPAVAAPRRHPPPARRRDPAGAGLWAVFAFVNWIGPISYFPFGRKQAAGEITSESAA